MTRTSAFTFWADDSKAILVTTEYDFGELVFRNEQVTYGVALLRLDGISLRPKTGENAMALRNMPLS